MMRLCTVLFTAWVFLLSGINIYSQEAEPEAVFVTTQDFSSLRLQPSVNAERIAIIPPGVTLAAVGRTVRTDWVQVEVEGELGWMAAWLLVWSGNIIELPVDGITAQPFIRRTVAYGKTFRETPIYRNGIDISTQIGTIPAEAEFEITGYIGTGESFWIQINYQNQLVWIGSWDVNILEGSIQNTLNAGYRYPYGRLNVQLRRDVDTSILSLLDIESIWARLRDGQSAACAPLPEYVVRRTVDRDLERETIFNPVVTALDEAIADVNASISRFDDICTAVQPTVTLTDVEEALNTLNRARRNITLAQALLNELRNRDPLFDE